MYMNIVEMNLKVCSILIIKQFFSKILIITILVIRFRQNEAYPKYEIRILFIPNHQLSKMEAADSKQQLM